MKEERRGASDMYIHIGSIRRSQRCLIVRRVSPVFLSLLILLLVSRI